MKPSIENIVSVIPLFFISIPCVKLFYNILFSMSIRNLLLYTSGIIITTTSIQMFKQLPYPSYLHKYTMRPKGATGCDYLSSKGLCRDNTPGMPSGHMGTTAFFIIYNYLYITQHYPAHYLHYKLPRSTLFTLFTGLLIIMGWARNKKKCHNIWQIIIGSIYGGFMGYVFYLI